MLHDHFLDLDLGPIGRVVTSEDSPATAHEFFFWTAETPPPRTSTSATSSPPKPKTQPP